MKRLNAFRRSTIAQACRLVLGLALAGSAAAQAPAPAKAEKPQYGGSLSIGVVYYTVSPLSFDAGDWTWKFNQDAGLTYEMLFAADLGKALRKGGKWDFRADAWLPTDGTRGELAEKWRVLENPWRVEVQLRKGVMFPAKPGVMAARELVADDIVYAFERLNKSPKKLAGYYDYVEKVEATDRHTVLFTFKNYNAEWDYRFGWGYYGAIQPREVAAAGAADWKNANGTGPFMLENYVQGNSMVFRKNPGYWDSETIGGQAHKLPFADSITYRIVKDESTMLTALKKSAPQMQWHRGLSMTTPMIALRTDTKPLDDVRVRRALNMAVNKAEIARSYWGGNAELLGHPMHPSWQGYYEPLEAMPDSIRELFVYDPAKAKKLLAEAGHPNGFSFKVLVSTASTNQDMWAMVAAYLAKVGVKMEIQLLEYPAYLSAMGTKKHPAGYAMELGGSNPTTSLRKSFVTGQYWNPSIYSDPGFDKKIQEMYAEPDERVRQVKVKLLNREVLEAAPMIWLPVPYLYTAWWPWVKNYGAELRAGAERPGPIHARIWVDQELKKKMGF